MEPPQPCPVTPIGYVVSPYRRLDDIPSQSSESEATGQVAVRPELTDGLLGLDSYQYVWVLTWLHDQREGPAPLQLIPRATEATGQVQGVFASRSPERPNPIGMSLVRLVAVSGDVITFAGVDLLDGTPVLDIKPWFADCDQPID